MFPRSTFFTRPRFGAIPRSARGSREPGHEIRSPARTWPGWTHAPPPSPLATRRRANKCGSGPGHGCGSSASSNDTESAGDNRSSGSIARSPGARVCSSGITADGYCGSGFHGSTVLFPSPPAASRRHSSTPRSKPPPTVPSGSSSSGRTLWISPRISCSASHNSGLIAPSRAAW